MFSHDSNASASKLEALFSATQIDRSSISTEDGKRGFAQTFDDFLDRMPAWLFHTVGILTALVALWFALAFLGGLPTGIVEWIALGMFGGFAYALGFMVPLILAFVVDGATRSSMLLALVACGTTIGLLNLPIGL